MASVYARYGQFLWKCLYRMGVPEADLPDAMQELLLVVHRRIDSYDRKSKLTTWLFGIGLRVAATSRRKLQRRREIAFDPDEGLHGTCESADTERLLLERDARRRLERALESLDVEQRALFTLYEVENMPCADIAELLSVPVGTVHSRLSKLREHFTLTLRRLEIQERSRFGGLP